MRIGLIDVDGHKYPNLPLMKLSAWHKRNGDEVLFYDPMFGGHYDKVYMSKVFTFTPDYEYFVNADEVVKGGTGYFYPDGGEELPYEIEHIMPDYSLYGITDTAYGFLSRGCPRGCDFCIVKHKEGCVSRRVASLSEFWNGQKNIELLDPNTLACKDWKDILRELIESNARVNFSQGLDIRMMTEEKADMLSQIKIDRIHFAYDRIEDKEWIEKKFIEFRQKSTIHPHHIQVYVLCGDRSRELLDEDLYRVNWLKENGFAPYVMLYEKDKLKKGCDLKRFQRYVNNRFVFWTTTWEEYR